MLVLSQVVNSVEGEVSKGLKVVGKKGQLPREAVNFRFGGQGVNSSNYWLLL